MAKLNLTAGTAVLALIAASCSQDGVKKEADAIDIAEAIAHPEELRVSDLGKTIKYVPLETTDSSLVSGSWILSAGDGAFLVANVGSEFGGGEVSCLSFTTDGKFISRVGHRGQDPEAYWSSIPIMAPDNKSAYFYASGMQHYAFDGSYLGKTPRESVIGIPGMTVTADTMFITVYDSQVGKYGPRCFSILSEGFNSTKVDTTDVIQFPREADPEVFYQGVSIFPVKGVMRNGRSLYMEYREGKNITYNGSNITESTWRVGEKDIHHRRTLNDTVFSITPSSAEIAYIFDCGETRLTKQILDKREDMPSDALFVSDIVETPGLIIFGACRGWMRTAGHERFVGIHDKKTGITRVGDGNAGFVDDLSGFMPFYPVTAMPDGRLVGVITMEDIDKYVGEHPDAKIPSAIADLEEEANPILVIVGD